MNIERLVHADDAARARVVGPLAESGTRGDFAFSPRHVVLALTDIEGIDGGLVAQIYWDWMTIEIVAVPERIRGAGFGRQLVEAAEAIAIEAGCTGAWVDTYSFQSPGFYEAMGYEPFGRLPDYPRGASRIFYAKRFDTDSNDSEGRADERT